MNLIKSIFILLAPLALMFIVVDALINANYSGNLYIKIGLILSALPLLLFFCHIFLFKNLARTNIHLPWVTVPSFLGYCMVLFIFMQSTDVLLVNAMVYALASFFVTFLYVYWYSNNGRTTSSVLLNSQALPDFSVSDYSGKLVHSSEFLGHRNLFFFYRGNWCPLCMAQIKEVVKLYNKFEAKNIKVLFISPQPASLTQKLAEKYTLSFKFYVDSRNQAAEKLGIDHKFGLPLGLQALGYDSASVYPTIIATDSHNKIIYNSQTSNYRIRPEPDKLLSIFS